jgi:preprotein translocase subunit SecD
MSEQAEANELVHDLRGKKMFAFEVARAQNINKLTKAAKTQKQRIELDSVSDTDPDTDSDAAEEVTGYLQQALVINSRTKATEKSANQTDSDVDETLTEDSEQQRTDAQTESTPAPSAPQLENIVENNEQAFSQQNAPKRREIQEIPLRPLYPLLTHFWETSQTGTKNTSTKSADMSPSNTSFATSADSDVTKYNQIVPTPVANQKIIEHHSIPSNEQAEKAKMEQCRMYSLLQPPHAPAYHVPIADAIIAP